MVVHLLLLKISILQNVQFWLLRPIFGDFLPNSFKFCDLASLSFLIKMQTEQSSDWPKNVFKKHKTRDIFWNVNLSVVIYQKHFFLSFLLFCRNQNPLKFLFIDSVVNQGNWSLLVKSRLECFVIIAKCTQYAKVLTYSLDDSKRQGCLWCQLCTQTLRNYWHRKQPCILELFGK